MTSQAESDASLAQEEDAQGLQEVIAVLQELKEENSELKQNFETLKGLHGQLTSAHKALQAQHAPLHEERVAVERQYQQLCESWRVELEEKQRQFEQARAQIAGQPRDLGVLRAQLLVELEGQYRAKTEQLSAEHEGTQAALIKLRRDHEALQSTARTVEARLRADMDHAAAQHQEQVSELQDRIAELVALPRAVELEARLADARRKHEEQALSLEHLRSEVSELRREKEEVQMDRDRLAIRTQQRMQQIKVEEAEMTGLMESLTRKNRHLSRELEEVTHSADAAHAQVLQLQASCNTLQAQLADARKLAAAQAAAAEAQHAEVQSGLQAKLAALMAEVHALEKAGREMEAAHAEASSKAQSAFDRRFQAQEEHWKAVVREAAGERAQLGVKAESLEATVKELSAELQELKHRSSKAADAAASQIESLTGRLAQAQASAAEWKGEAEALRKECEGLKVERATAEGLLNSAADSRGALEREQEKALDANASLGRQLEAARERISELQAEIQELELLTSGSMQEARQAWALEKSALTKRHVEHVRSLEAKHAKALGTLKRKLKRAEGEADELRSEAAMLKVRLHELEAYGEELQARPTSLAGLLASAAAATSARGAYSVVSAVGAPLPDYLAEVDKLRERQDAYLRAASDFTSISSAAGTVAVH